MFNDYFRVRDLKEWLETIPQEERKNCLCIIGGDDHFDYLNVSTQDVNNLCEFEVSDPGLGGSIVHRGLLIQGQERTGDYTYLELDDEVPGSDCENSNGYSTVLVEVRTDIKEVLVLDGFGYKMTAEDILKKLEGVDPEIPLIYDSVDLKASCNCGIGWGDKPEEILPSLECGIWNWHSEDKDGNVAREVPSTVKKAFIIELYDGAGASDLSIWEEP